MQLAKSMKSVYAMHALEVRRLLFSVQCTDDADIINISLGSLTDTEFMSEAVAAADLAGIFVVASAGNEGSSTVRFPAAYAPQGAMGISATDTTQGENRTSLMKRWAMNPMTSAGSTPKTRLP